MVTENDIFKFMESLNIKHSDAVTVHSSLRSVGEIENGADGLIDGLKKYLYDGLLIIPTHTWGTVNKDNPYYNVKTSVPCIGTLAKVAAFRPDGVRSLHPTHSVAVFGNGAKEFVKGEEKCTTPAPVGCCLSRLYELNGKILLIGVTHRRNTYLHAVDEMLDIKNRLSNDTFKIKIEDYNGNIYETGEFHRHYCEGFGCGCHEYFPNYEKALEYTGAVTYGKLGNARVYCCDAKKTADTVKMLWSKATYDLCSLNKPVPEEYYKK